MRTVSSPSWSEIEWETTAEWIAIATIAIKPAHSIFGRTGDTSSTFSGSLRSRARSNFLALCDLPSRDHADGACRNNHVSRFTVKTSPVMMILKGDTDRLSQLKSSAFCLLPPDEDEGNERRQLPSSNPEQQQQLRLRTPPTNPATRTDGPPPRFFLFRLSQSVFLLTVSLPFLVPCSSTLFYLQRWASNRARRMRRMRRVHRSPTEPSSSLFCPKAITATLARC